MLKNLRSTIKTITFLVSFPLLSFQPIFSAKPANSYILKKDLTLNEKNIGEFRKKLGGELKKEIYRVIDQYPDLAKKYARTTQNEIKVTPVSPHFTLLMLGDIDTSGATMGCMEDEIQKALDSSTIPPTTLKITNKLPFIFIQGQQKNVEVSFIGIDIKKLLQPQWEAFTKKN